MFARYSGPLANPIPVSAAILTLAAVSLAAVPAHGFDLKPSWEDAMKAATDRLNTPGKENPEGNGKSPGEELVDSEVDRLAGKAADKIEEGMWKAGEKVWKGLEATKTLGPTMKKLGKRWGPAAKMGTRLSPHVGTALTSWELGHAVGEVISEKIVNPLIDRHFENEWKEQEEELRRDIEHNRSLGEQRRQGKETVSNMWAVGLAMKKLREDKRGPWAATDDPWGEDGKGANAGARDAQDPRAKNDPWAPESPDVRTRQPVALQAAPGSVEERNDPWAPDSSDAQPARPFAVQAAPAPTKKEDTGTIAEARGAKDPWVKNDPWAPESPDDRFARPVAVKTAPATVKEAETGPSNYEKALNALQGGSTQSAGYEKALEKLEADRRAEQVRKKAEAEAARVRRLARAAEERRQQAAREAEARGQAAARDRQRQEQYERATREQRKHTRPNYNQGVPSVNRALETLRQTRQQQQRAYRRQKVLQQQRQRQQQLEQARRERIYEQQRARDRQTYQTFGGRGGSGYGGSSSGSGSSYRGSSGQGRGGGGAQQ